MNREMKIEIDNRIYYWDEDNGIIKDNSWWGDKLGIADTLKEAKKIIKEYHQTLCFLNKRKKQREKEFNKYYKRRIN